MNVKTKRQISPRMLIVGLVLTLSACTNPYDPVQRTIGGGLIGAGSGAAIGAAAAGWGRADIGQIQRDCDGNERRDGFEGAGIVSSDTACAGRAGGGRGIGPGDSVAGRGGGSLWSASKIGSRADSRILFDRGLSL